MHSQKLIQNTTNNVYVTFSGARYLNLTVDDLCHIKIGNLLSFKTNPRQKKIPGYYKITPDRINLYRIKLYYGRKKIFIS
jgi:hypothetical protein